MKVHRRLLEKFPDLDVSPRSVRRYVNRLKETVVEKQQRYYQPVLDMVPGEQCQVDPGELRGVLVNGTETTVYFCVFVLSYSRLMHVSVSAKPINTQKFIEMHDTAFRYFGGVTAECVYDQTKLVVISEIYRELTLNNRFCEYATHAGFRIHACEGYDPESKGKVEAGVKYVKGNGLYGEIFQDWSDLEHYVATWVDTIANQRMHAATHEQPQSRYESREKAFMKSYFTPCILSKAEPLQTRKVDKTGLISYASNKYSVPMKYQSSTVSIQIDGTSLFITDVENQAVIATHVIERARGLVLKQSHHYRDPAQKISTLEIELQAAIGQELTELLCAGLKKSYPKVYKDQLVAVTGMLSKYTVIPKAVIYKCCQRQQVSATLLRDLLEAYDRDPTPFIAEHPPEEPVQTGALAAYTDLSAGGDL